MWLQKQFYKLGNALSEEAAVAFSGHYFLHVFLKEFRYNGGNSDFLDTVKRKLNKFDKHGPVVQPPVLPAVPHAVPLPPVRARLYKKVHVLIFLIFSD